MEGRLQVAIGPDITELVFGARRRSAALGRQAGVELPGAGRGGVAGGTVGLQLWAYIAPAGLASYDLVIG